MNQPLSPATPEAMSQLAQALLATCLNTPQPLRRAQEREAWTLAILSYARKQRCREERPGESSSVRWQ